MLNELDRCRIFARVLSRPTFAALAAGQPPERVFSFLRAAGEYRRGQTVASVYETAFDLLSKSYRNEYVYKAAIADRIVFGRHSPRTSSLAVELPVGRSIVDVAVFNGTSTAYEIKTEFDSPKRLVTQTPDYLRAFERVFVVTHPASVARYEAACDPRVGLLALEARGRLRLVREAGSNAEHVEPRVQFRMLRRSEYVLALQALTGEPIDLPNGLVAGHCEKLFTDLPREVAHREFVAALRSRTTSAADADFLTSLPTHLRVLGFSSQLSSPQRSRILSLLDTGLH